MKYVWLLPALAATAFFLFSVWTIAVTGQPLGFIAEHTHSTWGAQIGIDLLNAAVAGLILGAPLARQYGFRLWPYVVLTFATGSPGLLALAARVLYARHAAASTRRESADGAHAASLAAGSRASA
jgi:hypothetical protein